MKALTLFSSIGIGEYLLKDIGVDVVVGNEIDRVRKTAHEFIYPDCDMILGDITNPLTKDAIVDAAMRNYVNLVIVTPPCQGLSLAGTNKTQTQLENDPRNYLVLSALDIINKLMPPYILIENVPRFANMLFVEKNNTYSLEQLLKKRYGKIYNIEINIYNAADYGVPQTRHRIVYRIWKKGLMWELPQKQSQITLRDAIGDLPSLEAGEDSGIVNHCARKHPLNHVNCMKHTPTGRSAFFNAEHYPKKVDGLPIKGFKNTFKRMRWDFPAPTITMRNEIVSSQENVHPGKPLSNGLWSDARVLTLRELLIVSSLPAEMKKPDNLSDTLFRQLIGEGIPPVLLKNIIKGIEIKSEKT